MSAIIAHSSFLRGPPDYVRQEEINIVSPLPADHTWTADFTYLDTQIQETIVSPSVWPKMNLV